MTLPRVLRCAAQAAVQKKAQDLVALDLRQSGTFTDHFLLISGTNQRQLVAIVDAVSQALRELGLRPHHVEGYPQREWILLDYGALVVHVFTPRLRDYYGLDRLWGQAPRQELGS